MASNVGLALGRLGRGVEAVALASDAVEAASATELVALRGDALLALAGAHEMAGRAEATLPAEEALSLFEQKGDVVSARKAADLVRP
jgi:hypothetical protein